MSPRDARAQQAGWIRLAAFLLTASLLTSACTTKRELAAQLEKATQQQHLPKVAACWERAFEAWKFEAWYEAVVDFTVEGGTGQIRDAALHKLENIGGHVRPGDVETEARLRRCLVEALNASSLADGGMTPSFDVHVTGFRFEFIDASDEARRAAAERTANMLIGPRSDRCDGLYSHEPPRKPSVLHGELASAEAAAEKAEKADPDAHARELQRSYDLALELRERLRRDAEAKGISEESRERTREEMARATKLAGKIGRRIGCRVRDGRP
jgi:hypothetical protein